MIKALVRAGVSLLLIGAGAACTSTTAGAGLVTPSAIPAAPNIVVDLAAATHTLDPHAIGLDESTYGHPSDATDATAQGLLRDLRAGYSRIGLTLADPADPAKGIVCLWPGCDRSIPGDMWITQVKAMGMTPIVAIPDTLSPAGAAAIVRRFNVDSHNRVASWVVGNEPDGRTNGETAAAYSGRFNRLYDAMKAVDATITVGGGATTSYDEPFLAEFLRDSGSRVDFVDMHFYPGGGDLSQLLAAPTALTGQLAGLRRLIDTEVPGRAERIAVHVGEYNFSWMPPVIDHYGYSGVASVMDAEMLGRVLAAGDSAMAWATKNGAYSAILGDTSSVPSGYAQDTPTPLYRAIGMFTGEGLFPHFGGTVVAAVSSLAGVDAFASRSPDEIVLVNRSAGDRVALVRAAGGGTHAAVWRLGPAGPGPAAPSPPVELGTATTTHGGFALSLPAHSVTTLVVTP